VRRAIGRTAIRRGRGTSLERGQHCTHFLRGDGQRHDACADRGSDGVRGWYAEGPIVDPDAAGPAIERAMRHVKEKRMPALVNTIVRRRVPRRYR